MMLGRNDTCLCGSGKKYKKCCYIKDGNWHQDILNFECNEGIKKVVLAAHDFIKERDLKGGCHLISAVMHILLNELGIESKIMIGEVKGDLFMFDHSWLEIEGKIIDVTVMNTLQDWIKLPPVILDLSVGSSMPVPYQYGVSANLDRVASDILKLSIAKYMINGANQGTFATLSDISKRADILFDDLNGILFKYQNVYRNLAVASE